jgi:F420-dependent oxidoreductase-like protein
VTELKVAINCSAEGALSPEAWQTMADSVREAERLGVSYCWSAEAWGSDAVSPIAYLAGRTQRIMLGTGVMQVFNRTPASVAMTALSLAALTGNRFVLGLGASGPGVVEGLHGARFARPLTRLSETIDIVRLAFAGERIAYDGKVFTLPLPGSQGKALRLAFPPNENIPIYLATMSPKALVVTGEKADGWLGTAFVPEGASAYLNHLEQGAERAGRTLSSLDLQEGGEVAFGDDVEEMVAERKKGLAFTLGGMGTETTNFYNDAYSRQGYSDVAKTVQDLWLSRRREAAAEAVPDELVLRTALIGTEDMVRDRIRAIRRAGITTLRLYPAGSSLDERVETLGRAMDLVREVNSESVVRDV